MQDKLIISLGDVAIIVDCEHKTAPLVEDSRYLSVRTSDISNGKIDFEKCNRVSFETYEAWTKRMQPKFGDIILAREAPVGEVGFVIADINVCLGQRTVLIRPNQTLIDNKYLLYYLVTPEVKYELVSHSTGSVVEHINVKDIKNFQLNIFSKIKYQSAVASILSSLDDKIDLLHRQNKTLEQMAEALFRQWFMVEAEEGWEVGTLEDVISVKGGTTPSTNVVEYWDGEVAWTTPRDLSNHTSVYLFDTGRKITEKGLAQIGSGLLPYLAISHIPVAINQGYIAILCDKVVSNLFIYLWCKANIEEIKNSGNGSTFQEISKSTFKNLSIVIPPKKKLIAFDAMMGPLFEKIKNNQIQIRTLTDLRDSLLPKLMSGEISIKY